MALTWISDGVRKGGFFLSVPNTTLAYQISVTGIQGVIVSIVGQGVYIHLVALAVYSEGCRWQTAARYRQPLYFLISNRQKQLWPVRKLSQSIRLAKEITLLIRPYRHRTSPGQLLRCSALRSLGSLARSRLSRDRVCAVSLLGVGPSYLYRSAQSPSGLLSDFGSCFCLCELERRTLANDFTQDFS